MATTTSKVFARTGAQGNEQITNLYTVPSATTAVVTNIVVANRGGQTYWFTLQFDELDVLSHVSIAANTTAFFDLKQVLTPGQAVSIRGFAESSDIAFHISGVEIA